MQGISCFLPPIHARHAWRPGNAHANLRSPPTWPSPGPWLQATNPERFPCMARPYRTDTCHLHCALSMFPVAPRAWVRRQCDLSTHVGGKGPSGHGMHRPRPGLRGKTCGGRFVALNGRRSPGIDHPGAERPLCAPSSEWTLLQKATDQEAQPGTRVWRDGFFRVKTAARRGATPLTPAARRPRCCSSFAGAHR